MTQPRSTLVSLHDTPWYHIVVRVDAERGLGWDRDEVLRRLTLLFTGPELVQRYQAQS
jgi:hypothetical protein